MKALSFKQPWAWLIFNGKNVDNRSWKTMYRGRIYVHASKGWDTIGFTWLFVHREKLEYERWWDRMMLSNAKNEMPFGAIVGEVDITDCVAYSDSPWFFGKYGLLLANPQLYDNPIPYKGRLRFFEVER